MSEFGPGAVRWLHVGLWLAQAFLALMYLYAGFMKLARPPEALAKLGWTWTLAMPPAFLRFMGIAEILGALGVVLPVMIHVLPFLTPLAALGLTVIQVGAIVLHAIRRELGAATILNIVLLAASVFVLFGYMSLMGVS